MKASIVMYTHSDVKDVWLPFFGQTEKFMNDYHKIIFVNKRDSKIPSSFQTCIYDDSMNYKDRLLKCLKEINDELIIFHHEDMFLYDSPDIERLDKYTEFLSNMDDMSFIKLIRGGNEVGIPSKVYPELKYITKNFEYIFAIQPTIWKKSKLIEMIEHSASGNIWEFEVHAQKACRDRNIYGFYVDDGGIQRGKYHWDSKVYPYVATAVVKGKWNNEYLFELNKLFIKYNINPEIRGWKDN